MLFDVTIQQTEYRDQVYRVCAESEYDAIEQALKDADADDYAFYDRPTKDLTIKATDIVLVYAKEGKP